MSSPDFSKLKQLLACKRYEQPPPGFFNRFSGRVLARIEAEEWNELTEYSSWWQWVVEKFDAKPVVACVYGLTISGLLLAGFRLSEIFETETAATSAHSLPWLATTPASQILVPADWNQPNLFDYNPGALVPSVHQVFGSSSAALGPISHTLPVQPIGFNAQNN